MCLFFLSVFKNDHSYKIVQSSCNTLVIAICSRSKVNLSPLSTRTFLISGASKRHWRAGNFGFFVLDSEASKYEQSSEVLMAHFCRKSTSYCCPN